MTRSRLSTCSKVAAPYERKPKEEALFEGFIARCRAKVPAPRVKVDNKGRVSRMIIEHPDEATGSALLMTALGTTDPNFINGLLSQLGNAGSQGPRLDEGSLNFMLAVVKGIEPKDQIEAMLGAQMAAVHMATMTFARRLGHVENIPQQDSAERAFNKLARTFATQVEALKRYQTGGEQRMTIEHVNVHAGGQAIVGNVSPTPGGGGVSKKLETTS